MVIIVLTHDVDWISVRSIRGSRTFLGFARRQLLRGDLSALRIPNWKNFKQWMELEKKYDVRSAFYFLSKGAGGSTYDFNNIENILKGLDREDWEIGLHGTYDSAKNLDVLMEEKTSLEKILRKPVYGIRLHYLRISEISLKLQEDAGFLYDSSLETTDFFEIFHPVIGNRRLNLVELPLTLHDSSLFVKEKMTVDEAYKFSRKIIDKAHKKDGIVTLNWHQRTFSPEFKSWLKTYVQLLKYVKRIGAEVLKPVEVVQRFEQKTAELADFLRLKR